MRLRFCFFALFAIASLSIAVPPDSEIRKILVERIDMERQSVGIVVGVIEPAGRRIVAYGSLEKGDTRSLNGDTVFEIGSITKVFTSLLLADMVERGEVSLSDPVAKYLPDGFKMPEGGGRPITLQDLSTHTSGFRACRRISRPTTRPIRTKDGNEIVWHNGGTGGYRTFAGFDPKARVGVVVLSNTETAVGVDDIGMHLLDAGSPLTHPKPPREHKEISVDPKLFDGYVGRYQLAPAFIIAVTREGGGLFVQATGQPKFQVFAESERDYFLKVVDAQITFETGGDGRATALVLHQNGLDQRAKRIE